MLLRTFVIVLCFPLSRHCVSALPLSQMNFVSRRFASRPRGRSGCARSSAYTSLLQHQAFSLPTARLTVTSKDRAPFGRMCPGSRTWVAPLSSRTYAGILEVAIAKSTILAHLVQVRGQDLRDLEQDLEKSRLGPDTHIFPQETTSHQTTSDQVSRAGLHSRSVEWSSSCSWHHVHKEQRDLELQ